MADTILIRAGTKAKMPVLLYRELGFCYDTGELYVGTGAGNILVGAIPQAEAVPQLSAEATTADVITTVNAIITNLQTVGLMKTEEI